jgi:hypothetical protein
VVLSVKHSLLKLRLLPVVIVTLGLVGGSLALAPRGVPSAEALTNCSVADFSINADEQAFLTLINNYRAQNGAPALQISTGLSRMSSWHAEDMASKNYFDHTDSLGRSFGTRLSQCDAAGGSAGENIAAGYQTAQDVFNGWRNSPGHNANMLNPAYRYIGIARVTGGSYGVYWVTDLSSTNPSAGGSSGGGSTPTPPPTQVAATMTSPAPGSTISGRTATFSWSAAAGADEYFLYVGTYAGSNNLYGRSQGLNRSVTVTNLPAGRTLYVRLWTRDGSTWRYIDYTYRTR